MTSPSSIGRSPEAEAFLVTTLSQEWIIDIAAAERAARDLLIALGADLTSAGLMDTPRRIAAAYAELLSPGPLTFTSFPNTEEHDELVVVSGIPFQSLCMDHLLPFHGVAHVGYVPGERTLGLAKFAHVVAFFAHELQPQERLTIEIADCIEEHIEPKGVGVILEAEHLCMSLHAAEASGTRTVTSALRGIMRDDPRTREEFLSLVPRPLSA
jgi:GTP cyclohydrolase IA